MDRKRKSPREIGREMEVGNACSVLVESKTDREKGDTSPLMQVIELTDLSVLVYTNGPVLI